MFFPGLAKSGFALRADNGHPVGRPLARDGGGIRHLMPYRAMMTLPHPAGLVNPFRCDSHIIFWTPLPRAVGTDIDLIPHFAVRLYDSHNYITHFDI